MCWNKVKGLNCNAPSIPYEPVENHFIAIVAQNAHKFLEEDLDVSGMVHELRGKLIEFDEQISRITEFVINGSGTKALVERQAALEKEADATRLELQIAESKLSSKANGAKLDLEEVTLRDLTENASIRRYVREFILTHVESLTFTLDRKELKFQFRSDRIGIMYNKTLSHHLTLGPNKIKTMPE
jgi:hypothetical protein